MEKAAKFTMVDDAGHAPNMEQSAQFNRLLADFVLAGQNQQTKKLTSILNSWPAPAAFLRAHFVSKVQVVEKAERVD